MTSMPELHLTPVKSIFIDLLRLFSAKLVMAGHLWNYIYGYKQSPAALLGDAQLYIQNLGVVIFFIISGYLIGFSLLRKQCYEKGYTFGQFFIDRFCRIYVTLIPCLIFIFFWTIIALLLTIIITFLMPLR